MTQKGNTLIGTGRAAFETDVRFHQNGRTFPFTSWHLSLMSGSPLKLKNEQQDDPDMYPFTTRADSTPHNRCCHRNRAATRGSWWSGASWQTSCVYWWGRSSPLIWEACRCAWRQTLGCSRYRSAYCSQNHVAQGPIPQGALRWVRTEDQQEVEGGSGDAPTLAASDAGGI